MREIKTTEGNSLLVGKELPLGCQLCIKGAKMVLFITGRCFNPSFCNFYCPLSENRKDKPITLANDRLVLNDDDVIQEVRRMNALGAGFTGGEPLIRKDLVLHYLSLLKNEFGSEFHVHLYTSAGPHLKASLFKELKEAGLDEIRFHLPETMWKNIQVAREMGLRVGAEVPAIREEYLKKLILFLDKIDGAFLNINELEICEPNASSLKKRGFVLKDDSIAGAAGSEELVLRILEWARLNTGVIIHYCPSALKDSVQFKNRMLRTAKIIRKPHETVTTDGLLYFGLIEDVSSAEMDEIIRLLQEEYQVPDDLIFKNENKSRVEVAWEVLTELAEDLKKLNFKCGLVEELPNNNRQRISFSPL